jgi:hypothetical protein
MLSSFFKKASESGSVDHSSLELILVLLVKPESIDKNNLFCLHQSKSSPKRNGF